MDGSAPVSDYLRCDDTLHARTSALRIIELSRPTFVSRAGVRDWNHATAGGAQGATKFDDCDHKLVLEAMQRLQIAADLFFNHSQPFFIGLGLRNAHIP